MALTTDQKASFLFKQAQGVAETSMLRDFFEEAIKGRILVLNNQLWAQSDSIPATAPVLADGATSGVVQYFQARSMTAVAGVSNAFYLSDLIDSIPFNFGDGSYNYVVTSSTGTTIPFGQGDWLVNNTAGTLTFYGSVPANMPPKISFYKYIGTKGGSTGGSGVTSVNGDPGPAVVLTAASVDAVGTTGGTMTGALTMNAQNEIRFADADSSNYVGFKADTAVATNVTWTLPSADGTDGYVLTTDGLGKLNWTAPGAATAGTLVNPTTGSTFEYGKANPSMTGTTNTVIGVYSGTNITTGTGNTVFGSGLSNLTTGNYNTAVGGNVLLANDAGSNNIAVGFSVFNSLSNTAISDNIGIGKDVATSVASASQNIAIGTSALQGITNAIRNVAIGYEAGKFLDAANYNTIINSVGPSGAFSGTVSIGTDSDGFGSAPQNNDEFVLGTDKHSYVLYGKVKENITISGSATLKPSVKLKDFTSTKTITITSPDILSNDITFTLPETAGLNGQVLKTDGAGVLSWVNPGAATAGTLVHPTSNSTFEYDGYNVSMTGIFNTAIGVNAGVSITNGTANSAFGERAGYQITSGADNVAVGSRALEFTTIGSYNVAVGKMALILNTSGDRNVAVGYSALYSNVSGQSNVAIGDEASKNLTSGSSNIAIGKTAMNAIGQGSYNTHIFSGYSGGVSDGSLIYSGTVLIGSDNLGGRPADPTNNNQFILGTSNHKYIFDGGLINSLKIAPYGDTAGQTSEIRFLELGANGTNYVGFKAPDNISANKIWVLPAADGTANQVLKTDGSGNLGWVSTSSAGSITHPTTGSTFEFGTENPLMTGSGNTAIGVGSGNSITSGEFNTVYGTDAGTALTTGLRNTLIGYSSGSSLSTGGNNTFIGMFTANGLSSGSHNIVIGDATGSGLTSGSFNTLINVQTTLPSTINGTVVIGRDSGGASGTATGSNQFILGTANHSYLLAGVVNSSLVLGPTGTSTGSGGIIRFRELAANGTNSVALRAADSIVSDITWTLPSADGTTGQVLTTNGTGTLSWTTPGSTGSISHPTTASTYEFGTANPSMTGLANTAYGVGAGDSVTSGESNSFYGRDAGTAITTGIRNNLIGFSAASSLTTGSRNTIIGALTGGSLISGDYNVIIGDANGGSMSGGSYNTIINVQTSMPASMSGTVIIGTDSAGNSSTASASNQFILGHSNHKYRMPGVFESAIDLGPIGTTTGSTGIVKFRELAANGTNFVAFRAADSIAADVTWTLPSADGTNGQVLTTNGTGTLTWTTAGGGGSGTGLAHPTTGSTFETGAYNVAITGTNNTAIGSTAGDSISSGTDNTAFGTNTLTAVTTGLRNTAIGSSAGVALTTQNDNTVMGAYAVSVYTNTGVTAVGSFAGRYSNSSSSTYIGSESASVNIISGTSNSSLGYRSLYNLSSGSSNVAIGSGAGLNLQTGSQNIVIGANAGAGLSGNNYCTILAGNTLGGIGGVVAIGMDSVGNRSSATADNQFVLGTFSHKYRFPGSVETTFVLGPTGTSAGQTGTLQFRELAVNGTNAVSFRAPDAIAADVTWTLPQADGTSGQALITNGSGTLSWSTIAGSGTFPPVSSGDYDFLDSAYRRWYPKINNIGSTSGTINIDLAVANYHRLTVTGNTTLNFQNVTTSTTLAAVWQVEINFSSAATISYQLNGVSKTINWDSSTAPSFTTGKLSILSFISPNGTTSIYGNISILNATP